MTGDERAHARSKSSKSRLFFDVLRCEYNRGLEKTSRLYQICCLTRQKTFEQNRIRRPCKEWPFGAHAIEHAGYYSTHVIRSQSRQSKKWFFSVDQISPSASSIRDLGTRLTEKKCTKQTAFSYWGLFFVIFRKFRTNHWQCFCFYWVRAMVIHTIFLNNNTTICLPYVKPLKHQSNVSNIRLQ